MSFIRVQNEGGRHNMPGSTLSEDLCAFCHAPLWAEQVPSTWTPVKMIIISQNGIIAARTLPECQSFFPCPTQRGGLHSINQLFCLPLYSQLTAFRTRKKCSSDNLTCSHRPMAAPRSAWALCGFPSLPSPGSRTFEDVCGGKDSGISHF